MTGFFTSGLGLVGNTIAIGSFPDVSGTTAEVGIKSNVLSGYEKFSTVYPTYGKLKATELIVKQSGRIVKATKRLNKKKKLNHVLNALP